MEELKRTPLYEQHIIAGGKMIDFGGWDMPVNYSEGILSEHLYTRRYAGLFDVSHMGRFLISGNEATKFLQYMLTNDGETLKINYAHYTLLANENGGVIDDAFLYRLAEETYLLVVNASNAERDWNHLSSHIENFSAKMADKTNEIAMLALQGPTSMEIMEKLSGLAELDQMKKNEVREIKMAGYSVNISRTGYTGEPFGFEIFMKHEDAAEIWDKIIATGGKPIGLGARDTLRLEAGMPLYGHEFGIGPDGEEIPAFAVPLTKFAVKLDEARGDFIGRHALRKQSENCPVKVVQIALTGKGIPRGGYPVLLNGERIGTMTSGTIVPYFDVIETDVTTEICGDGDKRGIGQALIGASEDFGENIEIEIRGKAVAGRIVRKHLKNDKKPFAVPVLAK